MLSVAMLTGESRNIKATLQLRKMKLVAILIIAKNDTRETGRRHRIMDEEFFLRLDTLERAYCSPEFMRANYLN